MKKKLNCILLIDDDEPTNFLNKMTVEQTGCADHVRVVQSGQEALDYLMGCGKHSAPAGSSGTGDTAAGKAGAGNDCPRPDLIFLDINMPAMDGWEFLEKYKLLPQAQKAHIIMIMLTTSLNPDDERRTRDIPEIAGFENKPLQRPRLEKILSRYFPGYC